MILEEKQLLILMKTNSEICKELVSNPEKFNKLEQFVSLVEEWNKKINLTGFEGENLWKEGINESFFCFEKILETKNLNDFENKSWVDIGSGAGFPIIPFAIIYPKINFYIIESNSKRVRFLELVNEKLNLKIKIFNTRAENFSELKFDFVSARAVAHLDLLIKYFMKITKQDATGYFIKGPKIFEEKEEINNKKISIETLKIDKIKEKNVFVVKMNRI